MIQIDFDAVHRLATVGSLIEPLRRAFLSPAVSPARAHYDLDAADQPRSLLLMPSWQPEGALGVKIVTVFPGNAARGSASVNAVYLLLSGQTGQPRAWIDGRALTLFRTAAVSALAADLLAPATPAVLLMVGTGALSRYLIEGHRAVRAYPSILVWGRDPQKAAAVARDLSGRGWPVRAAADLQAAVRSADVISCATLAEQPLIEGAWLKSACHLDLVGSFRSSMREADDDCLRGAFIAVDTLDALKASGDLISPLAAGVIVKEKISSLTDLVAQTDKAARASRTVFKTIGVAHADLAAAEQIYERHDRSMNQQS
jgi:ornithine cyclodeaminase/alanine dehydrogenase-like protein (mu-crystallin family)